MSRIAEDIQVFEHGFFSGKVAISVQNGDDSAADFPELFGVAEDTDGEVALEGLLIDMGDGLKCRENERDFLKIAAEILGVFVRLKAVQLCAAEGGQDLVLTGILFVQGAQLLLQVLSGLSLSPACISSAESCRYRAASPPPSGTLLTNPPP